MIILERGHMIIQKVTGAVKFQLAQIKHMSQTLSLEQTKHTNLSAQVEQLTTIMCMTTFNSCSLCPSLLLNLRLVFM